MSKLIVIVQCAKVCERCAGANCAHAFYSRTGAFEGVPSDAMYLTFDCGGCGGGGLPIKLENLNRRLKKLGVEKDDVTVHLASCVISDNHHRPPCPFMNHIRHIIGRWGFKTALGSYRSQTADRRRAEGMYKPWPAE